jgi:Fe-S cluster biogenesis protein NfuA
MADEQVIPVSIYVEMTPNPAAMKFVANKLLIDDGKQAEFLSMSEAKGYSPLAEKLFNFPFVTGVFFSNNFVAVTKNESINWDYVTMELREYISDFLKNGGVAVSLIPEPKEEAAKISLEPAEPSEYDDQIKATLDEYIRPAVEGDGGAIEFVSFKDGIVTVLMRGACSGCPSSTATLKGGIEALLQRIIPDVKEVVALEG